MGSLPTAKPTLFPVSYLCSLSSGWGGVFPWKVRIIPKALPAETCPPSGGGVCVPQLYRQGSAACGESLLTSLRSALGSASCDR